MWNHGPDSCSRNWIFMLENHKKIPLGYIGPCRKLEVFDWPPSNAEITMEIT